MPSPMVAAGEEWVRDIRVGMEMGSVAGMSRCGGVYVGCVYAACVYAGCVYAGCVNAGCVKAGCVKAGCEAVWGYSDVVG